MPNPTVKNSKITNQTEVEEPNRENAAAAAQKYSIEKVMSLEEILKNLQIGLAVNRTGPSAHCGVVNCSIVRPYLLSVLRHGRRKDCAVNDSVLDCG